MLFYPLIFLFTPYLHKVRIWLKLNYTLYAYTGQSLGAVLRSVRSCRMSTASMTVASKTKLNHRQYPVMAKMRDDFSLDPTFADTRIGPK